MSLLKLKKRSKPAIVQQLKVVASKTLGEFAKINTNAANQQLCSNLKWWQLKVVCLCVKLKQIKIGSREFIIVINMQESQKEIVNILKKLKQNFSAIAVKADFEAEGTNLEELIFLNQIVGQVGLNLFVKIGGCEAVFDLTQAKLFGANVVIVPVVETDFAMSKFISAIERVYGQNYGGVDFVLNAETKTCAENFDEILKCGAHVLNAVTIGRVDLVHSFGLTRSEIDSNLIFKVCCKFFELAKNKGLQVGLGGGLTEQTYDFLRAIEFDRFETRKIVFKNEPHSKVSFKAAILEATKFELECLKCNSGLVNGGLMFNEKRIKMMEDRLKKLEF